MGQKLPQPVRPRPFGDHSARLTNDPTRHRPRRVGLRAQGGTYIPPAPHAPPVNLQPDDVIEPPPPPPPKNLPSRVFCATGFFDELILFHTDTLCELYRFRTPGHNVRVIDIPFDPLVAISEKGRPNCVRLIDLTTMRVVRVLSSVGIGYQNQGRMWGLDVVVPGDYCSESVRILSGGGRPVFQIPDAVIVWHAISGLPLCHLPEPPSRVGIIKVVEEWDSQVFVGALRNKIVNRYDLESQKLIGYSLAHEKDASVRGIAVHRPNEVFFTAGTDMHAFMHSRKTGQPVSDTLRLGSKACSMECAEGSNMLIVGMTHGWIDLWDIRNLSRRLEKIAAAEGAIYDIKTSGDSFVLVSVDGSIIVLNQSTGKTIRKTSSHDNEKMVGLAVATTDSMDFSLLSMIQDEEERVQFIIEMANSISMQIAVDINGLALSLSKLWFDGERL